MEAGTPPPKTLPPLQKTPDASHEELLAKALASRAFASLLPRVHHFVCVRVSPAHGTVGLFVAVPPLAARDIKMYSPEWYAKQKHDKAAEAKRAGTPPRR
jgi:hypothetical protein